MKDKEMIVGIGEWGNLLHNATKRKRIEKNG